MQAILARFRHIDFVLSCVRALIVGAGLLTMDSFQAHNAFFNRQFVWTLVSLVVFFGLSALDFHFLKRTGVIVGIFCRDRQPPPVACRPRVGVQGRAELVQCRPLRHPAG